MDYSTTNIEPANYYFYNRSVKTHGQDYYNNLTAKTAPIDNLPDYNSWDCNRWIDFHKRLKARYGKSDANLVWSEYFNNKPQGWTRDKVCTGQKTFTTYFEEQGIKFDNNFYSLVPSFGVIGKNLKTGLIVAGITVGALVLLYGAYVAYNAYTMRKIAVGGLKKAADNPELVAKGAAAGLKGGI